MEFNKSNSIGCFNILIVEDAKHLHKITENVFFEETVFGKPLQFFSAFNEAEAIEKLNHHHKEIAVILLDIVMTEENGGLRIIEHLQHKLGNLNTQIIIRTGEPGKFPMREIIDKYNIHGYIDKGDTSDDKLYVAVKSSIRAYSAIISLEGDVSERTIELEQTFSVSTPLLQIGTDRTIIRANDSFKDLFQIENKKIEGLPCHKVLNCDKNNTIYCCYEKLINGNDEKVKYENHKVLPNGKDIEYEVNAIPIKDGQNRISSIVENVVDITKSKQLVRNAEEQNKRKNDFLSQVSHDVRTPINSILLNSKILRNNINIDDLSISNLDSINTSSIVLLDLIDDILTHSVLREGKLKLKHQPTNIHGIIKEIDQIFRLSIESKGLKFINTISDEIPNSLLLDRKRIRQILINLIGNAKKYTEKGEIKLTTKFLDIKNEEIDLIFEVLDTGIGIPKDKQDKSFIAFEMIHEEKSKGIGLGLSIVKQLVEEMGGEVILESKAGKGSEFTIKIPNIKISNEQPNFEKSYETANVIFEEGILLIADDTPNVRINIQRLLSETKIEVLEASNGEEAIEKIIKYRPHLVLMDIMMPVMNGIEATKAVKSNELIKHTPIIAYTASQTKFDLNENIDLFDGYISKTDKDVTGMLYQEIQKYIQNRVIVSENTFDIEYEFARIPDEIKKNSKIARKLKILIRDWEKKDLCNSFNLDKALKFGKKVREFGEKYNFPALEKYGQLISGNDIHLLKYKNMLNRFPQIYQMINK